MDCNKLAQIYRRSCVEVCEKGYTVDQKIQLDKNCMKVMQIMKRSCYQFEKKEEYQQLLLGNSVVV
jgi:hypothetical protein